MFGFCGTRSGKTEGGAEKFALRIYQEIVDEVRRLSQAGVQNIDGYYPDEWRPDRGKLPTDDDEPRKLYWVLAPSYKLAQIAWRKVRTVLRRLGSLVVATKAGVVWLRTGVRIEMRTAADEEKLQGEKIAGSLADELCTWPEASWNQLLVRLSDSGGWCVGISSPRPGSWPKGRIWDALFGRREAADPAIHERGVGGNDTAGVHMWTTLDNPWVPKALVEAARRDLPAKWFKRDFLADWNTFEGLVYSELLVAPEGRDLGNVIDFDERLLPDLEIDLLVDFGFRRPAFIFCAEVPGGSSDGLDTADVLFEEVVLDQVQIDAALHRVADICDRLDFTIRNVLCDPAGNQRKDDGKPSVFRTREILQKRNVLRGAVKWPRSPMERSIANGVATVAHRICDGAGVRRLFVARELTRLVRLSHYPRGAVGVYGSLTGYVWKGNTDKPHKDEVHDHFCDGIRYGMVCKHGVIRDMEQWSPVDPGEPDSRGPHMDFPQPEDDLDSAEPWT